MNAPSLSLPELKWVYTVKFKVSDPIVISNVPGGHRYIFNAGEGAIGTFEGPGLKGTVSGPGGDWVTVGADGSVKLDMRFIMTTDDGATILWKVESGVSQRDVDNPMKAAIRGAATYETGDERYKYLNNKLYVSKGVKNGNDITIDYFELI